MANEKEVSAENAQAIAVENTDNSEQFIESENIENEGAVSNLDNLRSMAKQFPHLVDDNMKAVLAAANEPKDKPTPEVKEEVKTETKDKDDDVEKDVAKKDDSDLSDVFGLSKKETSISKEFKGLEEFMGVIKEKHAIEDPNTLINSIGKWRNDSQKAKEFEEKHESLWNDLNALPQDLKQSINAYANGEDYKTAFQSSATLLDYNKEFKAQNKEELVKTYFGDKVKKLNEKLSNDDIDEDDFNDRVNDLHELTERLYSSDKTQYEKQRAESLRKQEESIEALKNSAISSVDNLKKTFPNFSDIEFKKIRNRLVNQDLSSVFFDNKGRYKADAAQKIAMALYGDKLLTQLQERAAKEATSKTTQEFVQRGNTEIKSSKTIGSTTSSSLKNEIENNYSGLFNKDPYS